MAGTPRSSLPEGWSSISPDSSERSADCYCRHLHNPGRSWLISVRPFLSISSFFSSRLNFRAKFQKFNRSFFDLPRCKWKPPPSQRFPVGRSVYSGNAENLTFSFHSSGNWSIIQYPFGIIATFPATKLLYATS